jgi:hypothetical protein
MSKAIKMTIVNISETYEEFYRDPSKWYINLATGDKCFFHCRDKNVAQVACDEYWGKGMHKIKTTVTPKSDKNITCR